MISSPFKCMYQLIVLACIAWTLIACGANYIKVGATLEDLPDIELPSEINPVPVSTIAVIQDQYRAALEVAQSPQMRHQILVRLADLEMTSSEDRQLTELEEKEHFSDAISMYSELLVLNQTQANKITDERLLYRLSKAYALDGRMDESDHALQRLIDLYPDSPFTAEVEFRRAEHAFIDGRYRDAEALYLQVVNAGPDTPFYLNAVYMHGWSLFKSNTFEQSITSFTEVLDRLLVLQASGNASGQSLIDDTLRVMAITFTYLNGAQSISDIYDTLGERPYQHMLYQQLGQLHIEKQRYQDAANTYRNYIEKFPDSPYGPELAVDMLDVFKKGGFPEQILPAKESYVANYGINSVFWASRLEQQRSELLPQLESYLDELSSYYHSEGQTLQKAWAQYNKASRKPKAKPQLAAPNFLKAADYYTQFIALFPKSERIGEMSFLKAEAYYEAGALAKAIRAYEHVAYTLMDAKHGAASGYSAILSLASLIEKTTDPEQKAKFETQKITNAISFADYYPNDPNAVVVLTQAAQKVFKAGQQKQAVEIAKRITLWQPAPPANLRKTAWLILAHSQFGASDYASSESSYREVLALLTLKAADRASIIERIAASMFKAAEQKVASGDLELAIKQFLDIEASSPGSEIALKAQYDAGNYLMDLSQWARAEAVFLSFQTRYATHALAATLPAKFVHIYQSLEQWDNAAAVLAKMANSAATPEERRQALYLSAELYQKSGNLKKAIGRYKAYVNGYPKPFDLALEARFQLLQLSEATGDTRAYRAWLKYIIAADKKAGTDRTARSKYLGAFASNYFANENFNQYEGIKLTLPIKKSLKAKKKALKATLKAYKGVLDYGVAEFATEANYRIGNVYSQLSRDLLDSERPKGLDELALEQYEILLEDQAYPFEEKSVALLTTNAERAWTGLYDDWVKKSFEELATILPARYGKKEKRQELSNGLH